ncbi:MAG TPA: hypothetical protein VLW50_27630 [Streptosporangiaceae bacterium]|nr:hypothetical protein [Streptosporangiaceae bacterium]
MAQQFRDEQRLTGHVREPAGLVRPAVVVATDADMGCARDIAGAARRDEGGHEGDESGRV